MNDVVWEFSKIITNSKQSLGKHYIVGYFTTFAHGNKIYFKPHVILNRNYKVNYFILFLYILKSFTTFISSSD